MNKNLFIISFSYFQRKEQKISNKYVFAYTEEGARDHFINKYPEYTITLITAADIADDVAPPEGATRNYRVEFNYKNSLVKKEVVIVRDEYTLIRVIKSRPDFDVPVCMAGNVSEMEATYMPLTKIFNVSYNLTTSYDSFSSMEVFADNEDEAEEKAKFIIMSAYELFTGNTIMIRSVIEV